MAQFSITVSKDGTVTIRVGRMVEHITGVGKTTEELWQAIKWACISKGIASDDPLLRAIYKDLHRRQ